MCMCEQWLLHCTSQGAVDTVECVCVLCGCCIRDDWVEQWICIKFCIKLGHYSAETIQMIQKAFRDDAMSAVQIKVWHKCFKDGQESVESDPCSGRHSASLRTLNVTATQYTCSLNGTYRPHLVQRSHYCSLMHIPVHSPWLPGYTTVM